MKQYVPIVVIVILFSGSYAPYFRRPNHITLSFKLLTFGLAAAIYLHSNQNEPTKQPSKSKRQINESE